MNPYLTAAAAIAFVTFLVHLIAGGHWIATPLLAAADLRRVPKLTSYYCWHLVTILLLAMSISLAYAARTPNRALVVLMLALAASFCLLSLAIVATFRVKPHRMPQWMFFLAIAILLSLGLARQ